MTKIFIYNEFNLTNSDFNNINDDYFETILTFEGKNNKKDSLIIKSLFNRFEFDIYTVCSDVHQYLEKSKELINGIFNIKFEIIEEDKLEPLLLMTKLYSSIKTTNLFNTFNYYENLENTTLSMKLWDKSQYVAITYQNGESIQNEVVNTNIENEQESTSIENEQESTNIENEVVNTSIENEQVNINNCDDLPTDTNITQDIIIGNIDDKDECTYICDNNYTIHSNFKKVVVNIYGDINGIINESSRVDIINDEIKIKLPSVGFNVNYEGILNIYGDINNCVLNSIFGGQIHVFGKINNCLIEAIHDDTEINIKGNVSNCIIRSLFNAEIYINNNDLDTSKIITFEGGKIIKNK